MYIASCVISLRYIINRLYCSNGFFFSACLATILVYFILAVAHVMENVSVMMGIAVSGKNKRFDIDGYFGPK